MQTGEGKQSIYLWPPSYSIHQQSEYMVWEDDYDIIITIIFYLSNFRGLFLDWFYPWSFLSKEEGTTYEMLQERYIGYSGYDTSKGIHKTVYNGFWLYYMD